MSKFKTWTREQKELNGEISEVLTNEISGDALILLGSNFSEIIDGNVKGTELVTFIRLHSPIIEKIAFNLDESETLVKDFFSESLPDDYYLEFVQLIFKFLFERKTPEVRKCTNIAFSGPMSYEFEEYIQYYSECIDCFNLICKEYRIGYECIPETGKIIRKDSEFAHEEIMKPALCLLNDPQFVEAENNFHDAWEHYSKGRNEEAIKMAGNALESVLKTIFTIKNWEFKNDSLKKLIAVAYREKLIPKEYQNRFSFLRGHLESAGMERNDASHGSETVKDKVPDYITSYVLQQTASHIMLLVNLHKNH